MSVPWQQSVAVLRHVFRQRIAGRKRYPLVLMLEPLMRCNLACAGCGKIQHPVEVLRKQLTVEQCLQAADECGAPVIAIPGGEPLLHPQIDEIVAGLVKRKRYVYLCTNAIKLKESLHKFTPSRFLAFSIHLDGPREVHDASVCRKGIYDIAIEAIEAARSAGFRVTTNTTIFNNTPQESLIELFDQLMRMGVEGMMVAPGYAYSKAPDQEGFLPREQTQQLFDNLLSHPNRKKWRFNQSPLYLEFLRGNYQMDCTAWGSPAYNIFGWQKPCYLLDEGYATSYAELLQSTRWEEYGHASGNPKCANCMTHCGFEPSAVAQTLGTWSGLRSTIAAMIGWQKASRAGSRGPRESLGVATGPTPALPIVTLEQVKDLRREKVA